MRHPEELLGRVATFRGRGAPNSAHEQMRTRQKSASCASSRRRWIWLDLGQRLVAPNYGRGAPSSCRVAQRQVTHGEGCFCPPPEQIEPLQGHFRASGREQRGVASSSRQRAHRRTGGASTARSATQRQEGVSGRGACVAGACCSAPLPSHGALSFPTRSSRAGCTVPISNEALAVGATGSFEPHARHRACAQSSKTCCSALPLWPQGCVESRGHCSTQDGCDNVESRGRVARGIC
mmetsp:Transcript_56285/g.150447  ORF Transcript_56285/g.150447 Transcript_56285/m.150447 type:complete len:236 (+) Transcript_56285:1351-2058(+)